MRSLYIVWSEKNELGIPIIDEQHRGIVSTINSFHYFIQEGRGDEVLEPTLATLENYTKIHFATEEDLMQRAGFPDLDKHKALHRTLMKRTTDISRESIYLKDPDMALRFLKEWWLGHINVEDRKYSPYVRKLTKV